MEQKHKQFSDFNEQFISKSDEAWVRELESVLKRMPKSLELVVTHGTIKVSPEGALLRSLDASTTRGNPNYESEVIDSIFAPRVVPYGESL